MRRTTKLSALLLSVALTLGGAACGGSSAVEVDEKTITIKCVKAGFGTDWIYELKDKFESVYATEGYKVNILTPDRSIKEESVARELALGYETAGVDLYITTNTTPDMVGELGEYGVLVEDLGDLVYNQPAISYDGTEESKTISEKISSDILPFMRDMKGKLYAFNWAQSSGGMVVNTRKLTKYGLEIPKTTNEMLDCFEKMYFGTNGVKGSMETGTYPITFVPGTANGYAKCFLEAMLAQYDGDFYKQFWSFQSKDKNGSVSNLSDEECLALYDHPAITEMLNVAYRTFDVQLSARGSTNQSLDQAQAKIMSDSNDAVFMFNGSWLLNEVKLNYGTKLNDIDFVNFPVVSALGTKLFGAGTSYNLSDEKCDELLSAIIDLVDANKSIDEIITAIADSEGITLAKADAEEAARARGVTYARGIEDYAYIAKGSPKKDIAAKFFRMMASDDFGQTFANKANGSTPYYSEENMTSEYAFVRNASKITSNKYFNLITARPTGYRKQLNLNTMFMSESHVPDHIVSTSSATIYKDGAYNGNDVSVYRTAAERLQAEEAEHNRDNWNNYKTSAGL